MIRRVVCLNEAIHGCTAEKKGHKFSLIVQRSISEQIRRSNTAMPDLRSRSSP